MCACARVCVCVCVLPAYNKAQTQIISNREFKLWMILQGTNSRVATFNIETCVMYPQSMCVSACVRVCVSECARVCKVICNELLKRYN